MATANMHAAAARMTASAGMPAATATGGMSTATPTTVSATPTAFRRGRVGRSRQHSRKNNNGNSKFESQHDFPQSI
jgi:hypothetical protein